MKEVVILLAAAALWTASAQAQVTVYTDESAWLAALHSGYSTDALSSPILNPGVSVASTVGMVGVARGIWSPQKVWLDRVTVAGGEFTTWSFTDPLYAWGGNWDLSPGGDGQGLAEKLTLEIGGQQIVGYQIRGPSELDGLPYGSFVGVISDQNFTGVTITAGDPNLGVAETYDFKDMVYASSVPDGGCTLAFMALGLCGLLAYSRFGRAVTV